MPQTHCLSHKRSYLPSFNFQILTFQEKKMLKAFHRIKQLNPLLIKFQVENLHKAGHEIASHSISYSFGELFSKVDGLLVTIR